MISGNEHIFTDIFDDLLPSLKHIFVIPQIQLPSIISNLDNYLNKLDPLLLIIAICLIHLIIYALLFTGAQANKNIHPSVIAMNHEVRLLAAEPPLERKQVAARPRARRILRSKMQEQLYRAAQRSTLGPQSGQKRKRVGDGEDGLKKARLGFILESLVV